MWIAWFAVLATLASLAAAGEVPVTVLFSSQIRYHLFFFLFPLFFSVTDSMVSGDLCSGAAMPVDLSGPSCVLNVSNEFPVPDPSLNRAYTECYGGAARREQYIRDVRSSGNTEVIVLDGGSSFWGGYMYYSFRNPDYMADLMSTAQYDAIAFSEADFLDGPSVLKSFVDRMNATGNAPAFLASKYSFLS